MASEVRRYVQLFLVLSILLGIATIFTIREIVPLFVVEGASVVLVLYVVALVLSLNMPKKRWPLAIPLVLSIFTILAVFSTTAHLQLIEEGYWPAIVIISSGLVSQSVLFILCVLALVRGKSRKEQLPPPEAKPPGTSV